MSEVEGVECFYRITHHKITGTEYQNKDKRIFCTSERFPDDFMFQLVNEEYDNLKSQFATSSLGWGGRRNIRMSLQNMGP